jgi:Cu(I)/Ag(I) efflux system membrane protein CusA/SilA
MSLSTAGWLFARFALRLAFGGRTGAPQMMAVVAIMAGLLPMLWSTGTGSAVMQRIAVPMIGGMISSTVLTLVVIPAVYASIKGWSLSPGPAPVYDHVTSHAR